MEAAEAVFQEEEVAVAVVFREVVLGVASEEAITDLFSDPVRITAAAGTDLIDPYITAEDVCPVL